MQSNRKRIAAILVGLASTFGASGAMAQQGGTLPGLSYSDKEFWADVKQTDGYANYGGSRTSVEPGAEGRPGAIRYAISPQTQAFYRLLSVSDGNPSGAPYDN